MRRVAVTTTADRFHRAAGPLIASGLEPVSLPCIRVDADPVASHRAASAASTADWVVVTSARAVEAVWPQGMPPLRVAAVGAATAGAVAEAGGRVEVTGDGGAEQLIARLGERLDGARVVFPGAAGAEKTVALLAAAGARLGFYPVYRTISIPPGPDAVDAAVFSSPSAVTGWTLARDLDGLVLAAMGETTAAALHRAGHPPQIVPHRPDYNEIATLLSQEERTMR